jgi:phosphoglycolate phosphatase
MLNFVRPDQVAAAVAIYRPYWNATMLQDVAALPGALDLLCALHTRGAQLAIFTNKHGPSSRLIADHLGFTPFLTANLGAQDTPWLKPEPAFTAHLLAHLGAEAANTLMVGDSPFDVQAALNAGFPCWAVATGTHTAAELTAAGATRVFPDLPTLQAALSEP